MLCSSVVYNTQQKNILSHHHHFLFLLRTTTTSVLDYLYTTVLYFNFYDFEGREEEKFKVEHFCWIEIKYNRFIIFQVNSNK